MAVNYGMSMIGELKEILARRRNVVEQFELYKRMYDVLIKELQQTFDTDIDTVCSALFLSRYVMSGVEGEQKRMSEIARQQRVGDYRQLSGRARRRRRHGENSGRNGACGSWQTRTARIPG